MEYRFVAEDETATDRLATLLADTLPAGSVVALSGTLGAGKTRLVQGVATALGVPAESVTSPTFVLVNAYHGGRLPVYHFDAYRLRDEDEFMELGPEEYFDGAGLTFVEWAERVESCLPREYVTVRIKIGGDTRREFEITGNSPQSELVVHELASRARGKSSSKG